MRIEVARYQGTEKQRKHARYLASEHWLKTRELFLKNHSCCEWCYEPARDVHHLHYETLGAETEHDLVALCRECHTEEHRRQRAHNRHRARVTGYARKVYGRNWNDTKSFNWVEADYERWLARTGR